MRIKKHGKNTRMPSSVLGDIKSQIAAGNNLPLKGCVFVSVRDEDKENIFLLDL